MASELSSKRALIDKANSRVVIVVGAAAFLAIFSLVATKTFISQYNYQKRVIHEKRTAYNQLKADVAAVDTLKKSYDAFTQTAQNAIGGNPLGTGQQDGSNTKIVLDALPSSYDFPALTTSLESMLASQSVQITNITGTDDEINQAANVAQTSPQAIPVPFDVSIAGNYDQVKGVINVFERSIRPMQFTKLEISGTQDKLNLSISAQTYYQPAKSLNITTKVVK
jgi:Tfp pilus assembly protein PilO